MLAATVSRETFDKTVGQSVYYRLIDSCKVHAFSLIVAIAVLIRLLVVLCSALGGMSA